VKHILEYAERALSTVSGVILLRVRSNDHHNNCQCHRSLDDLVQACLFLRVERPLSGATPGPSHRSTLLLPVSLGTPPFILYRAYMLPSSSYNKFFHSPHVPPNLLALYIVIEKLASRSLRSGLHTATANININTRVNISINHVRRRSSSALIL
jgi:hypothetical protein